MIKEIFMISLNVFRVEATYVLSGLTCNLSKVWGQFDFFILFYRKMI